MEEKGIGNTKQKQNKGKRKIIRRENCTRRQRMAERKEKEKESVAKT